jgi:hypothetical protein
VIVRSTIDRDTWQTVTDGEGHYALQTTLSGVATVAFCERLLDGAAVRHEPVVRSDVTPVEAQTTTVHATMPATAIAITGRIRDDGTSWPLTGEVQLRNDSGIVLASTPLDANGAYALPCPSAGQYSVAAFASSYTMFRDHGRGSISIRRRPHRA